MIMKNEPTSRDAIARLEGELGLTLPAEYVEFLLDQNGGLPHDNIFAVGDGNKSGVRFFGVETGHDYDDLGKTARTFRARLPSGFLPIGDDPGRNLIAIAASGPDAGSIWFWDHELEADEDEEPTRDNMVRMTATLSEFIAGLTLDPDADWA